MINPSEYQCYHCRVWALKQLWGPGRTLCPNCGQRAPTVAEQRMLEADARLGRAFLEVADALDAGACRVCLKGRATLLPGKFLFPRVDGLPGVEARLAEVEHDHTPCAERLAAMALARETWGRGAFVGYGNPLKNWTLGQVFYVGQRAAGEIKVIGIGNSWEEAFANARAVGFQLKETG